jgi:hypothetical protein
VVGLFDVFKLRLLEVAVKGVALRVVRSGHGSGNWLMMAVGGRPREGFQRNRKDM